MIKIIATRCYILKLKCTKFGFGLGLPPQTPLGSSQRSSKRPSWIQVVLHLREKRGEKEKGEGEEREMGKGKGKKRGEREGRSEGNIPPPWLKPRSATASPYPTVLLPILYTTYCLATIHASQRDWWQKTDRRHIVVSYPILDLTVG